MMNNAITQRRPVCDFLEQRRDTVGSLIPRGVVDVDRFMANAMLAINTPKLDGCSQQSVVRAVLGAARLGVSLDPVMGQAAIVKRELKNGGMTAIFQMMYKGWLELANRSRVIAAVHCYVVHQNDEFDEILGTERKLIHRKWDLLGAQSSGALQYAYCTWRDVRSNTFEWHRIGLERIRRAQSASPSFGAKYTPWKTDEEAMWKKTAMLSARHYWPANDELQLAAHWDFQAESGEQQDTPGHEIVAECAAEELDPLDELDGGATADDAPIDDDAIDAALG